MLLLCNYVSLRTRPGVKWKRRALCQSARRQFGQVGFPCLVSFFARTANITVKAVPATIQDAI